MWSGALVALAGDPGSGSSTHMTVHNYLYPVPSSDLLNHQAHMCTYTHAGKTLIHIA